MMDINDNNTCLLDQFRNQFEDEVISEWADAYINFPALQYYLYFFKNVYDRHHHEFFKNHQAHIEIIPLDPETRQNIEQAQHFIQQVVASGEHKVQQFIKFKSDEIVYYWEQIIEVVIENEVGQESHQTFEKRSDIKLMLRIIYSNITFLKQYISLNRKISQCVELVQQQYIHPFISQPMFLHQQILPDHYYINERFVSNLSKSSNSYRIETTEVKDYQTSILNLLEDAVKSLYSSITYLNKNEESKLTELARLTKKTSSSKNSFFLGLYIGLGIVILVSLVILLILNFISFDYDENRIDSMNYIFPMFRGVGLLILYLWGMAWNVYGFTIYKINFRNILEYGSHYSTHFQIMKRAGFFTLVFALMMFLYLLGLEINQSSEVNLPIEYTPFMVWTIYLLYIFFPNREVFNPRGRKYFYLLVKKILLTPIVKMSFLISYASDQLVSFIVPIKDFAYTLCFYTSSFAVEDVKSCLKSDSFDGIIIAYVVAIVPLLIRMMQCFKQARQSSGQFFGHLQMWNFCKYLASVITSTLSFFTSIHPQLLVAFIISSVVSTSYSYYWDLKNDWGFLEKGSKHRFLRNNLCYKRPFIYYVAIVINLIFRCSWTLTISPSVVKLIPKSTFLPFLTGLIQIFRRCMWNFFRIEKEHVINCAAFSVIKQKPSQILKRIQSRNTSKSFKLLEDPQASFIHYVKLSNNDDMAYYKKLINLELPKVSLETIQQEEKEFLAKMNEEKGLISMWEKQVKGHIFYDMKQKFY